MSYDRYEASQDAYTDAVEAEMRDGDECPECGFEGWEHHATRPRLVRWWLEHVRPWWTGREFEVWLWAESGLGHADGIETPCPNCGHSACEERLLAAEIVEEADGRYDWIMQHSPTMAALGRGFR